MQEHSLWWLSGLLEGEDWFGLNKQISNYTGKEIVNPALSIKMVDNDIISRVHKIIGHGSITKTRLPSGKTAYNYRTSGRKAVSLMRELQSLMGDRRAHKIGEILAAWDLKQGKANAENSANNSHKNGARELETDQVL